MMPILESLNPATPDQVSRLETLYTLTDRLYRASSPADVLDAAIDAICDALNCGRASILLFDDADVCQFRAWRGLSDQYRSDVTGHSPWKAGETDAEPIYVRDAATYGFGQDLARCLARERIESLAFIPLTCKGRVVGKFMAYHEPPHIYSDEERQAALSIARQLGFAIERQSSEDQLRESRARLKEMSEDAPVMIWLSDESGACQHLNRKLREFWGVKENDLQSFNWQTSMHPEDSARILAAIGKALQDQTPATVCGRYYNAGGELRTLETSAQPRYSGGVFCGLIGVNLDITDRVAAERRLTESETRLEIATQAAALGIWDWDIKNNTFVYSDRARQICGFPPEQPVSFEDVRRVTHAEDLPRTSELARRALDPALRENIPYEYRLRLRDGTEKWVIAHGEALFEESGGVSRAVRYVGTIQDITERRRTLEALGNSESRLRLALDAGRMAVFEYDLEDRSFIGSPELNRLLGFPEESNPTLEQMAVGYLPGEQARVQQVALEALHRNDAFFEVEYGYRRQDGRVCSLLLRAEIKTSQGAEPTRIVGVMLDVTERRHALERQKLLVDELNHRVKNTLASVQSIVAQTLRNADVRGPIRDLIESRLLALSAAHDLLTKQTWQGAGLLQIVTSALRPFAASDRISIAGQDVYLSPRHALALSMAFHELATNASKYGALSNEAGSVAVQWDTDHTAKDRQIVIHWCERDGPPVRPPSRSGFGSRLVQRSLAAELGGEVSLDFPPQGARCKIIAPLPVRAD